MPKVTRRVAIYLEAVNRIGPALKEAEAQLSSFSKIGSQVKTAATVMGTAVAAFGGAAVKSGADFEQAMANVGAVTRATEEQMKALEKRARDLGASTAFSASDAAEAMYALASGGMKTNEIIAASEGVLKLAGATLSDMGSAAELTMSALRQFGLSASETDRVVNVFAASIQNSMLNMERLGYSMQFVGPVAAGVGMSIEQTTAALALLHNAGMKGSLAGTGLRMALARLLEPSEELRKVLGGVSVETDGLAAVLKKLEDANLSASEMTELFGARAFNAINALVKAGSKGLDEMTAKLTGTSAAFEMYDRQMATTQSKAKILWSAIQETWIAVFDAIQPTLNKAIEAVTKFVSDSRQQIVAFYRALAGYAGQAFNWITKALKFLSDHWDTVSALLAGAASGAVAFVALTKAVAGFNAVLKVTTLLANLNPVSIIVMGVSALIAVLVTVVQKMGGWHVVWVKLKSAASKALVHLRAGLLKVFEVVKVLARAFLHYPEVVVLSLAGAWRVVKRFAEMAGAAFSDLGKMLANPFKAKETWSHLKSVLSDGFDGILGDIKDTASAVWTVVGGSYDEAMQRIDDQVQASLAKINADTERALAKAEEAKAAAGNTGVFSGQGGSNGGAGVLLSPDEQMALMETMNNIQLSLAMGALSATGTARKATENMTDSVQQAMDATEDAARMAMDGVGDAIADAVTRGENLFQSLGNVARSVFGSIVSGFVKLGIASLFPSLSPVMGLSVAGARAAGGPVAAGSLYLVGERGPELFVPNVSGMIIPNVRNGTPALAAAGAPQLTVNVTVPQGSLLLADNDLSVRRFAETIHRVIEGKVKKTYRE